MQDVISFAHAVWWFAENPSVSLGKWGLLQAAGSWGEEALPVFFSHWGVMWYVCSLSLDILLFFSVCWLYYLIILNSSSDPNGCPALLPSINLYLIANWSSLYFLVSKFWKGTRSAGFICLSCLRKSMILMEGLFSEAGSVGRADLRRDTASLLSCRGHPTFHCLLLCEMGVIMFCLLHRVNYKDQLWGFWEF